MTVINNEQTVIYNTVDMTMTADKWHGTVRALQAFCEHQAAGYIRGRLFLVHGKMPCELRVPVDVYLSYRKAVHRSLVPLELSAGTWYKIRLVALSRMEYEFAIIIRDTMNDLGGAFWSEEPVRIYVPSQYKETVMKVIDAIRDGTDPRQVIA